MHILIFSKCMYLHVEMNPIYVTVGSNHWWQLCGRWNCRGLALDVSACTMITVSSCGVKLKSWEKNAETLGMHVHFCDFSFIHSFLHIFFQSWCNHVLFSSWTLPHTVVYAPSTSVFKWLLSITFKVHVLALHFRGPCTVVYAKKIMCLLTVKWVPGRR